MPAVKINTKNGENYTQTFELTYEQGQYPKKIAFDIFGRDKIANCNITTGENVICHIDFDTAEYNGRLFNRVRCWKVERVQVQQPVQMPQQQPQPTNMYPQPQPGTDDTLPF